jgi:hypothetical protein
MMKIVLLGAMVAAASAAKYQWNGKGLSIGDKQMWSSDGDALAPNDEDNAEDIKGLVFGQEGVEGKLVVPVSNGELHSGLKITFNSATKLVLGDGTGKAKLVFDGGKKAKTVLTFFPGSGKAADVDMTKKYDHTLDVMCHTNWVTTDGKTLPPQKSEDGKTFTYVGPCDADTINFDTNAEIFDLAAGTSATRGDDEIIFATLLGSEKRFFDAIKLGGKNRGCDDDTGALAVTEDDAASYQLDLGTCGSRKSDNYEIGGDAKKTSCLSTCPPAMAMADGSSVVSVGDGEYAIVDANGKVVAQDDDNKVTATADKDGKVMLDVAVVDKDGKAQKFNAKVDPESKEVPKAVVAITTTPGPETTKGGDVTTKDGGAGGGDGGGDTSSSSSTPAPDDDAAKTDKSSGTKKKDDDSSMTIVIVIVVIVVLLVIIIAVVVVVMKTKAGGSPGDRSVVSFENPMYDTQGNKQNPIAGNQQMQQQPAGGYQDVTPQQGMEGTYAEPFENQQAASSGYMDVQGAAPAGGGSTGYMDVAPNQNTVDMGDDDDDGEDV